MSQTPEGFYTLNGEDIERVRQVVTMRRLERRGEAAAVKQAKKAQREAKRATRSAAGSTAVPETAAAGGTVVAAPAVAAARLGLQQQPEEQQKGEQPRLPGGPPGAACGVVAAPAPAPVSATQLGWGVPGCAPPSVGAAAGQHTPCSVVPSSAAAPRAALALAPLALAASAAAPRGARRRTRMRTQVLAVCAADVPDAAPGGSQGTSSGSLEQLMGALPGGGELLQAQEERDLAVLVRDLLQLEAARDALHAVLGRPPSDAEWAAAAGARDAWALSSRLRRCRAAKASMVRRNLRLVVSMCTRYQSLGVPMSDLVAEGIAGLLKGVEKFEPARGFKFSTYAHWWIRQAITRCLNNQTRMVRLPGHMNEHLSRLRRAQEQLTGELHRPPSNAELAARLSLSSAKLSALMEVQHLPVSLEAQAGDGEGGVYGDTVQDESSETPEEANAGDALALDVDNALHELPPRERVVLRLRFGLDDGTERTLDEIARVFNVTRERVRQLEAKAMRRLRSHQLGDSAALLQEYEAGELETKELAVRSCGAARKPA